MNKSAEKQQNPVLSFFRNFWSKVKKGVNADSAVSTRRKAYNSIWSVVFGIFISSIVLLVFFQTNPFEFFAQVFNATATKGNIDWVYIFIIYSLASIGVGFSFKTGLFNIGVAGQMSLSGVICLALINQSNVIESNGVIKNQGLVFLIMLLSIVIGFLYAAIAGLCKAFFNIHEVVSTILLNWVAVYIGSFIFGSKSPFNNSFVFKNTSTGSAPINISGGFFDKSSFWIFGIVLVAFVSLTLYMIFAFTSLGYKIKMNGLNKDASSYAGVNQKLTTVLSMGFSGALAGLAGFIHFVFKAKQYDVITLTSPLPLGFDTIAISLIGINSPIGILFSSVFYTMLEFSRIELISFYSTSGVKEGGIDLVVGVIIFTSALALMFTNFRPIRKFRLWISLLTQKVYKGHYQIYKEKVKAVKENTKTLLIEARKVYAENKPKYKEIKSKIRDIENEALIKVKQGTDKKLDKKLSNREIEKIFQKLAKDKVALNQELSRYGYFDIKDIKNLKNVKLTQLKVELKKIQEELLDNYLFIESRLIFAQRLYDQKHYKIVKEHNLEQFKNELFYLYEDKKAMIKDLNKQIKSAQAQNNAELVNKLTDELAKSREELTQIKANYDVYKKDLLASYKGIEVKNDSSDENSNIGISQDLFHHYKEKVKAIEAVITGGN
ncbi:Sugar ABC transporter Permease [Mycoplasmopsis agalactiae 14628]|uniref:Sugar ABC transporter Permease n=1 Tax=Mycoplasmopsis agalactiae 14628 TaxID=1110504 RepID=I5D585_MYCAA|nr:sugar ABC transporter permease [Mycoplasmopsis agalactiae]EIN14844.1 Sugar ABC transporter Permease [Mycoplasmopsis agalactiae 14628]